MHLLTVQFMSLAHAAQSLDDMTVSFKHRLRRATGAVVGATTVAPASQGSRYKLTV